MNINATEELNKVMDDLDVKIKHLEASPNSVFVLIEYETLNSFHWFNLCFKQFWDKFDRQSVSQLLLFDRITTVFSKLCDRYVSLLREQIDYLEDVLDFEHNSVKELPPVIFGEDNCTDVIGFYDELLKNEKDKEGKPLYNIDIDKGTNFEMIDGEDVPIDYYMIRNDTLNKEHYQSLLGMYNCLSSIFNLMCVVCSYPDELISGYKPSQEVMISALEIEFRQYAREIGNKVERNLKKRAQDLKPNRNFHLSADDWGHVMEEEDLLFDLAISGQLIDNKENRFEGILDYQRRLLTDNISLLQKIKDTSIDDELFDIRLAVETHQLLLALNADNLNLFFELVLRRNIIHREMFPKELKDKYEAWLNTSEDDEFFEEVNNEILTPDPLLAQEAKIYWERLKENNFVDENYKLLKTTTRQEAACIAETFAGKLGIKTKWKTFQDFWGINNLAQEITKIHDTGKTPPRESDINEIFKD